MRVGHVIGQLTAGGAEGQLRLLTCEPSRRSTPFVYCLSERLDPYGRILEESGVPVRLVGGGRWTRVRRLRDMLAADKVNIVHSWLFIGNAYAWAANGGRRPLVASARNCKKQGAVLDWVNRRAFARSSAIITNSKLVEDYIRRVYAAPGDRIRVVYNGIDLARFSQRWREAPPAAPTIVGIGRLVRQKNPELFVAGAVRLLEKIPAARFQWVGAGGMQARLAAEVERRGLGVRIEFLGERADVEKILDGADLFWLTSDWEGLPNVVMEAMASGLPVVATEVGGTAELFTGAEGKLIAPGAEAALVGATVELLGDAAAYAAASQAALESARRFAVTKMVSDMEQVYDDVRSQVLG